MSFVLLLIYTVLILTRPFEYGGTASNIPILPVILGFAFFAWIFERKKYFNAPHYPLIIGLLFSIFISVLLTGHVGGAVRYFIDFSTIALYFFLIANTATSVEKIRTLSWAYVFSLLVIALHSIQQSQSGIGWSGAITVGAGRITYVGFLNDPNDLGAAFVIATGLLAYLGFRHKSPIVSKLMMVCISPVFLYCIYLTNSRGALLAVGSMLAVKALFGRRKFLSLFIIVPVASVGLLFGPNRAAEINVNEQSASERVDAWYEGIQMLKTHPLFGVGQNQFVEHHYLTAHNSFVLVMAELGVVGFFFWFSLIVVSVWYLYRLSKKGFAGMKKGESISATSELASWWLITTIGFLVCSFFLSRAYTLLLYFLLGVVAALYHMQPRNDPISIFFTLRKRWKSLVVAELAGLAMIWITVTVLLRLSR